jgi:hypothetical protein
VTQIHGDASLPPSRRQAYDPAVIELPMLLNSVFSCSRRNNIAAVTPSAMTDASNAYSNQVLTFRSGKRTVSAAFSSIEDSIKEL